MISDSVAIGSYRRRLSFSCCFPLDLLPFAALGWLCLGVIVESPAQG
jgi:hypothetical protein